MSKAPDFIVHNEGDTVGVVVVENATAGKELTGWIMASDRTITLAALADIPLGHKIAVKPMAVGDTVIKYDHDIGRAIEAIPAGAYIHAHNIKTKRW
ncbi:MAG TPA: UxaA family hydrolase [Geminicoccaceae bacterium]|nr:UxaA family hydrolase [Geminicoccaceae bacterium]